MEPRRIDRAFHMSAQEVAAALGVAITLGGTEVSRDAADMVLIDDNFSTIEAAVREGRSIFDNLVQFFVWTLPTNIGKGLVLLVVVVISSAAAFSHGLCQDCARNLREEAGITQK